MAIKLFVTDLDGTLLNCDHRVSEENKQAIAELAARGVTVTIATGRMHISALPYARQLSLDVPIITYNGAMIKSVGGKVYYEAYLEPDVVREVCQFAMGRGLYVHSYDENKLYLREYGEKAKRYEEAAGVKGEVVGDGIMEIAERVPKMLIITDEERETDRFIAELNETYKGRLSAVKSNPEYIEIVRPGVNKANALAILMKKLDVTREETMAIGDSNNDLPMLKEAGFSVAMGNANDNVKAVCDAVTGTCAENGVAMAIRRYILNGRA